MNVGDQLRRSLATASSIAHWRELLSARNAAREILTGLEDRIEQDDFVVVQFGIPRRSAQPMRIKYSHARLIAVEAYLSLTWSLADSVSAFVGRVLCSSDGGAFNTQQSPKLVSHFVNSKDSLRQSTAGLVFDSIRQTFGWPIAVSYALRNHFIHDGAQQHDLVFFAATTQWIDSQSGRMDGNMCAIGLSLTRSCPTICEGAPTGPPHRRMICVSSSTSASGKPTKPWAYWLDQRARQCLCT